MHDMPFPFEDIHAPAWARELREAQLAILERIKTLMSMVQIDQSALDTLAASIEAAVTAVKAEIDSLKQTLPAADLSGLDTAVSNLQALEVPATTPAPTPTPAPAASDTPAPAPASDATAPAAAPDPSSTPAPVVEPPFTPTTGS